MYQAVFPAIRADACTVGELDLRVNGNRECTVGGIHPFCIGSYGKMNQAAIGCPHFKICGSRADAVCVRHKGRGNIEHLFAAFFADKADTHCILIKVCGYIFASECERITVDIRGLFNNDIFLYTVALNRILVICIWFNVSKCENIRYVNAFPEIFVKMRLYALVFVFLVLSCIYKYLMYALLN